MKGNDVLRVTLLLSYIVLTIGGKEHKSINSEENIDHILRNQQVNRTIQVEDGDIYDCVDVNLQRTFKHPLFKDHKIQMEPSSFPIGLDIKSPLVGAVSEAQVSTINCPIGTVPILQNNKVDNMMVQRIGTLDSDSDKSLGAGLEYWGEIYGIRASINVYEPKVKKDSKDFSASWIQISHASKSAHGVGIGVGSSVDPSFNDDTFARFHISWDNEELNKSCTDHDCPGFVQVSRSVGLGGRIQPISVHNGPRYVINVLIFKDPKTKNWWLAYGSNNTLIGYWPSSQFSYIKDKGDYAFMGGYVMGPTVASDPPQMGSGHFASEGFGKAAFIRNIQIIEGKDNKLVTPNIRDVDPLTDDEKLYNYDGFGLNNDGMHVYYGGPGKYNEMM